VTRDPAALYSSSRDRAAAMGAWLLAALLSALLIAAVKYGSGDPDSKLYAGISARMAQQPIGRWIAPEWWGFWGLTGPYQEHPIGMFVIPALLARAGYPAEQAAYAVNGFFQILSFALMAAIGVAVMAPRDARALAWVLQLLPIAFVFRVRANQEYTMLAGLLLALYATERARRQPAWVVGMIAGFAWVLFVKGVFAFMVPLVCGVWLIARTASRDEARRSWPVFLGVLAMPAVGALLAVAYDAAYVQVTGGSFLAAYRARQVPEGALTGGSAPVRVAYQLLWYAGRVIWYAFPWSLAAMLLAWRHREGWLGPFGGRRQVVRRRIRLKADPTAAASTATEAGIGPPSARHELTTRSSRLGTSAGSGFSRIEQDAALTDTGRGAWFALASSALLVLVFSLAHRKADRYIFPVYFIVAAAGAAFLMRRSSRFAALVERLDRPWVPAAAWMTLFLLRLATLGKLPEFTFWRS
jgi:4-amino-4-deoxy-L-arabinose transferase-like glycosyltransferase